MSLLIHPLTLTPVPLVDIVGIITLPTLTFVKINNYHTILKLVIVEVGADIVMNVKYKLHVLLVKLPYVYPRKVRERLAVL
jgi:hypothetical protein